MKNELSAPNEWLPSRKNDSLSHREAIKEYVMSGGEGSELTEFQKQLLVRWEYADEKIRENMGKINRAAIAQLVVNKFGVSLCTAKSDLVNAEYVCSSSNPLNKAYKIQARIEFLEREIQRASTSSNLKERSRVEKLEKVLAYYITISPEAIPVEVPKTLIFSFDVTKLQDNILPEDETDNILDAQFQKNKLIDSMSEDLDEYEEGDGDD
jgi:hypothetical protein